MLIKKKDYEAAIKAVKDADEKIESTINKKIDRNRCEIIVRDRVGRSFPYEDVMNLICTNDCLEFDYISDSGFINHARFNQSAIIGYEVGKVYSTTL